MSIGYLDILDDLLADGVAPLGRPFQHCQANFVITRQLPDGGFPGRQGGADLYYSDFALRILTLFAPEDDAVGRLQGHLAHLRSLTPPLDLITCFSLLHLRRLLQRGDRALTLELPPILHCLEAHRSAEGGFARQPGGAGSAYATFLAALCGEMLDRAFPAAEQAVAALRNLQCADGGFRDLPDDQRGQLGQTNATAAALAFFVLRDVLTAGIADPALAFLLAMQSADGGWRAHAEAPLSDLLSTFTAVMTLSALDALPRANLATLARFLRQLAVPAGGFRAGLLDEEPDLEYSYYGIGTLALLRSYLKNLNLPA